MRTQTPEWYEKARQRAYKKADEYVKLAYPEDAPKALIDEYWHRCFQSEYYKLIGVPTK